MDAAAAGRGIYIVAAPRNRGTAPPDSHAVIERLFWEDATRTLSSSGVRPPTYRGARLTPVVSRFCRRASPPDCAHGSAAGVPVTPGGSATTASSPEHQYRPPESARDLPMQCSWANWAA